MAQATKICARVDSVRRREGTPDDQLEVMVDYFFKQGSPRADRKLLIIQSVNDESDLRKDLAQAIATAFSVPGQTLRPKDIMVLGL